MELLTYFIYGTAFFSLGLILWSRVRPFRTSPRAALFRILGLFAVLQGVEAWLRMLAVAEYWPLLLRGAALGVELISYLSLAYFGVLSLHVRGTVYRLLAAGPLLATALSAGLSLGLNRGAGLEDLLPALELWLRWLTGMPASLLGATILIWNHHFLYRRDRVDRSLATAGVMLAVFALLLPATDVVGFPPASWWNAPMLEGFLGVGPELLRTAAALGLMMSLLRSLDVFDVYEKRELTRRTSEALRENRERLYTVIRNAPVVLFETDHRGVLTFVQGRGLDRLGLQATALTGSSIAELFPEHESFRESMERALAGETVHTTAGLQNVIFDTWFFPARNDYGERTGVSGVAVDVSEQRRAMEALRRSEERYRMIVETAHEGIWVMDAEGRTSFVNEKMADMLGYKTSELEQSNFLAFLDDQSREDALQFLSDDARHAGQAEYKFRKKNGFDLWALVSASPIRDEGGERAGGLAMVTDITERKMAEEQLYKLAYFDSLTGLPNRKNFMDRLDDVTKEASERKEHFALLFIDLDRFKVVNDSLGHLFGDLLLKEIARRLQEAVSERGMTARLGGDEFCILLYGPEKNEALQTAVRIQDHVGRPVKLGGREVTVQASIGVVHSEEGYEKPEHYLRDADTAMYAAKARGRARYEVFDARMHQNAMRQLDLETDLRHALENNELEMFYQPLLGLDDGRVQGVEALMRWKHPRRGQIPPIEFITLAEESGLILQLGQWAMFQACQQLKEWRANGYDWITMAVNLSPHQFRDERLEDTVRQALAESRIPSDHLTLEITETATLGETEFTMRTLRTLRELGVRISIDDFGTGYSSMSYLTKYPLQAIKIDRSFVWNMVTDSDEASIVSAIIAMAHGLNMKVVAEGVERKEQMEYLKKMGCDYIQGFYISKALPPDQAVRFFLK